LQRRQVFLKIISKILGNLFSPPHSKCALSRHSSAAKRRDFDLLSQLRQALSENSFSEPPSTQRAKPAFTNHTTTRRRFRQALRCDQRSPLL